MPNEVFLTSTLGKENVPVLNQQQLAYVLLEILPTEVVASTQMPLNFCLALDTSGSMSGEKIECLKDAVKYVIDLLGDQDVISLIAFDSSSHALVRSQRIKNQSDKTDLKRQVDKLNAGGGTNMGPAMEMAISEIKKQWSPNAINRLVLLTDGQTTGERDCHKQADRANKENIPILAFGIGADWNENLLIEIADKSGGRADYIAQAHEIAPYFQSTVQSMQSAVIQNASLTLRLVTGIETRKVWRVVPVIGDLGYSPISGHGVTLHLGELEKGQGQALLVELMLPMRQQGVYRIAQAEVAYDVPALNLVQEKVKADIVVNFTSDPVLAQHVNPKVMNVAEKVTAFKLQTRALSEADAGDWENATRKLRAAATILLNQGDLDLARTVRLEADQLEQQRQMSAEGKKTIQFKGGKTVRLNPDS